MTAIRIELFYDGSQLLAACKEREEYFELIFLDIEMPEVNGLTTGQAI